MIKLSATWISSCIAAALYGFKSQVLFFPFCFDSFPSVAKISKAAVFSYHQREKLQLHLKKSAGCRRNV
uniref:Uncharacterized protein n=1 Tax=Anguilla anguilla TaxID=7936 RepID=A0A0E9WQH9_ANGAN